VNSTYDQENVLLDCSSRIELLKEKLSVLDSNQLDLEQICTAKRNAMRDERRRSEIVSSSLNISYYLRHGGLSLGGFTPRMAKEGNEKLIKALSPPVVRLSHAL